MKKSIIKITAAAVFTFISFTALAQNAADRKPKIDESNKTTEAPQIVPAAKELKAEEQAKPIVPGGKFKPMDTNTPPVTKDNIKIQSTDKDQPVMPAPSAQDRAKPVPAQVILQKQ